MSSPFDAFLGLSPELELATSVDAYLDRLEKVLRIRAMMKEQDMPIKPYDEALEQIIMHMTAALKKAQEATKKAEEKEA